VTPTQSVVFCFVKNMRYSVKHRKRVNVIILEVIKYFKILSTMFDHVSDNKPELLIHSLSM
jgi:hypothetical protein